MCLIQKRYCNYCTLLRFTVSPIPRFVLKERFLYTFSTNRFTVPEIIKIIILILGVATQALGSSREVEKAVKAWRSYVEGTYTVAGFTLDAAKVLSWYLGPVACAPLVPCNVAGNTIGVCPGIFRRK